jgi:hypothetical protein
MIHPPGPPRVKKSETVHARMKSGRSLRWDELIWCCRYELMRNVSEQRREALTKAIIFFNRMIAEGVAVPGESIPYIGVAR